MLTINQVSEKVWSVSEILVDNYKSSEYGSVILPLIMLRRFDCLSFKTEKYLNVNRNNNANIESTTNTFKNSGELCLKSFCSENFSIELFDDYITGFSKEIRSSLDIFGFEEQIQRLNDLKLLHNLVKRFCEFNLSANYVTNFEMATLFNELLSKNSRFINEPIKITFQEGNHLQLEYLLWSELHKNVLIEAGIIMENYLNERLNYFQLPYLNEAVYKS